MVVIATGGVVVGTKPNAYLMPDIALGNSIGNFLGCLLRGLVSRRYLVALGINVTGCKIGDQKGNNF